MKREIVNNFSPADREFYIHEFAFFEQVTRPWKELQRIPKTDKLQRNEELWKQLVEINLTFSGLYLPTDHTCELEEITASSGVTLQSSSRVPFLCTFKIKSRNCVDNVEVPEVAKITEVIEEDEPNDTEPVSKSLAACRTCCSVCYLPSERRC